VKACEWHAPLKARSVAQHGTNPDDSGISSQTRCPSPLAIHLRRRFWSTGFVQRENESGDSRRRRSRKRIAFCPIFRCDCKTLPNEHSAGVRDFAVFNSRRTCPATHANSPRSEADAGQHIRRNRRGVPGYAKKVRAVPAWLKRQAYAEYGITQYTTGDYEVDHLIPLSLGGANSIRNLWPQSTRTAPWNSYVKDALERKLHKLVCAGQLDLKTAQREIGSKRTRNTSIKPLRRL
jgi:5-methylcytosine-specific restriction endonuclease McrA